MNPIQRRLLAILAVALVFASFFYYLQKKSENNSNLLVLYGHVDIRQVNLAFNAAGRIERLYAQEGDEVKEGQLLAELERERYEANVNRLKAQVEAQKAVLAALQAGTRKQQIEAAKAAVQKAEVLFQNTEREYLRLKRLLEGNAVSRQAFEGAETAYQAAQHDLKSAQEALSLAIEGPRKEDIEAARATLASYEAALEYALQELKDTRLYAPSNGIVENRLLEPGDMAGPNIPVLTLALREPLWVRCYVDEPNLGKIRPGMKATILSDSFPNKTYEGRIGYISPTAEFTPKPVETTELRTKLVYQVRVFVKDSQNELRLGMPVTVKIDYQKAVE
jgi:HlyD family secretion protein